MRLVWHVNSADIKYNLHPKNARIAEIPMIAKPASQITEIKEGQSVPKSDSSNSFHDIDSPNPMK